MAIYQRVSVAIQVIFCKQNSAVNINSNDELKKATFLQVKENSLDLHFLKGFTRVQATKDWKYQSLKRKD